MARQTEKPLLSSENQTRWEGINREEERQEVEFAASLSMADRVAYGQKLSKQAVALLASSAKAGHVPKRALRS